MSSNTEHGKSALILWTIRHKSIIYLIVAVLVGIGIYGISKMNKDEYPSFEIKQGLVAAVYPGASSLQVEEQVAKPVEQVLLSFDEVNSQNLQITSRDGICYMLVDLTSPARTKDEVWSKIKMKLNETKSTLPPGVLALVVIDDFASVSSSLIAMESEDKSYTELKELADKLCENLRSIPELAAVTDNALVSDLLVFSAVALPVLGGAENALTEQAVALRLERTVVDRFRLLYLAPGPFPDLFGRCQPDPDRVKGHRLIYFILCCCFRHCALLPKRGRLRPDAASRQIAKAYSSISSKLSSRSSSRSSTVPSSSALTSSPPSLNS